MINFNHFQMKINLLGMYSFMAIIEQDEDGMYMARVPDLPGCHTQARTLPELHKRLQEAASLCLEEQKSKHAEIPQPKFIGIQQLQLNA